MNMLPFSWGANSHGQLGLGEVNEQVETPAPVSIDDHSYKLHTKQIACGGGHSLLLDNEGKLFSCGWNLKHQLGVEKQNVYKFERVWPLSGVYFTNIECGWDSSCGVTDDHFLFVWGSNSHGQLGLPKSHFLDTVKPIKLQVNACSVSMGLRHTAIINSKGEVWATGCGKHGQLGLGYGTMFSDRFQKVPNIGKISHIACGQNHTTAWNSEEKALYVWGDNRHGQLLLDISDNYRKIYNPQKIDIDVKQPVKKLLSGWTNVLLWLENGSVFTWGRNNYGQLGTDDSFVGKKFEIKLPGGRQVKDISLGSEHTICLATDNSLWAWGWNEHGNTGAKLLEPCVFAPSLVPIKCGVNSTITKIYAGGAHNFVIVEEGEQL